jgi:hypothetical protein
LQQLLSSLHRGGQLPDSDFEDLMKDDGSLQLSGSKAGGGIGQSVDGNPLGGPESDLIRDAEDFLRSTSPQIK